MMLSVIIPSYKDPFVHKTIESILENSETELEIIVILDGYTPEKQITTDPRVRTIHLYKNRGMREAINAGVAMASGEYLMRTDEHCMFAKGFDRIILESIKDNEIMTPRRYFLDVEKWEVMSDIPPVDYEKLVIDPHHKKFSGQRWSKRAKEWKYLQIDETMMIQGSCWFMKRSWWDEVVGELQTEGYGELYQDQLEMIFKTWKAGGKVMVNKNTWFAHKHRKFSRTHHYSGAKSRASWDYSLETWGEYYKNVIVPKWL